MSAEIKNRIRYALLEGFAGVVLDDRLALSFDNVEGDIDEAVDELYNEYTTAKKIIL